jgi:predicted transcriptional regulator
MPKHKPTSAELAILRVLWAHGPSTVRDVHSALEDRGTGYTTVLKTMQIMTDKKMLARDERAKSHVYRALATEAETQKSVVLDLMERAFGGSATDLVMSALASKPASKEELAQIRDLIDRMESRGSRSEAGPSQKRGKR